MEITKMYKSSVTQWTHRDVKQQYSRLHELCSHNSCEQDATATLHKASVEVSAESLSSVVPKQTASSSLCVSVSARAAANLFWSEHDAS